jgi:uncharacterized protein with von Willebrand factor type A (vWA) domain
MEGVPPAVALAGFARAVVAAGITATPDRRRDFLCACALLGAGDPDGVYWAGRATLGPGPEQVAAFDAVFARWFTGELPRGTALGTPGTGSAGVMSAVGAVGAVGAIGEAGAGGVAVPMAASELEVLRQRDLAAFGPGDLARVTRLFAAIRPRPPLRRSRRRRPSTTGAPDPRRTLRADLRRGGEPGPLLYRRRAVRPRRVVLLLDVSGSMAPYAEALLRLAHVWARAAPRSTEVFTMGTRLTRISGPLRERDPAAALAAAGSAVPDWSGGTRLGEVLRAFLDGRGGRGTARGAVVVIASDGWERGDAALLGEQMARLGRLAYRVVWASPHVARPGYRPVQAGIRAALPHCDAFLAGHSLATFAELTEVVAHA